MCPFERWDPDDMKGQESNSIRETIVEQIADRLDIIGNKLEKKIGAYRKRATG